MQGDVKWPLEWDPNNPQEMNSGSSVEVNVIGRCAPFTWYVSDVGFSLAESQTQGEFNTLIADETACGAAEIVVADSCENEVAGYVRSTSGQWVLISEGECVLPGYGYPTWVDQYRRTGEHISGKGKQVESICKSYFSTRYFCEGNPCDGWTGSVFCRCPAELGQERCLGYTVLPYDGGWPCAELGDSRHYVWCGCVAALRYYEWQCQ
ncbi:MAG: hypothetical protein PVI55_04960 [Desulfobacterales bacterium]